MPSPTPPPSQGQLPAQAVHRQFATRPTLVSVVFSALNRRIQMRYPTQALDLTKVKLASPIDSGGYALKLLLNIAVDHVLNPKLLDFGPAFDKPCYLTDAPANIDVQDIAKIIDELPSTLYMDYQQALADYWSEFDSHGNSRWEWLGKFLRSQLIATAAQHPDLNSEQRSMLEAVAMWPTLHERLRGSTPATYAYFIETTLTKPGQQATLLTPDLLLVTNKQVVLCGVDGTIAGFDDIDAFSHAWSAKMKHRYEFDTATWRRNEPDGNVFEQQAGLILNQQLEDLANLALQGQNEEILERYLDKLTEPALLVSKVPRATGTTLDKVNDRLPEWLQQAGADDRFAYHRLLQDMAQVMQQNQSRSFNEGIENVHSFSRKALREQMKTDHGDVDPDNVMLDFTLAAGYPGGAGIIEHRRMSLTELAIKNLAGKPSGTVRIYSSGDQALPDWLTQDYLLGSSGLIQRVDIGTTYPHTIREHLLSDSADARRRELLFTRELRVRLPMQALEFKIKRLYGMTTMGYRFVKALLDESPQDRTVNGQEIVLRPLALCRQAHATPDAVENCFIIETRQATAGPHLLYRPLYSDCLHEFATRQALLDAIATPGPLQDSVLEWLPDKVRPIYAEGGIKEPHILRFFSGDEAAIHTKPAPATLALDEGAEEWLQSQVNGHLLKHLFGSTARALVDLADRASVSNSESRWAVLMEGAWLLFNTLLLPLVKGPAMLAGWFLVLVSSLEYDLKGLDSNDPTTRELALIDLLLNVAMVLLHATRPSDPSQRALAELAAQDNALHMTPWLRSPGVPPTLEATSIRQGSVALSGEPPASGHTALDFIHSLASPKASTTLLNALLEVRIPWPPTLPAPQAQGPLKGLYRINNLWHATVGGLLFRVAVTPGFGEVYLIHPQHPLRPGFKLVSNGQGHWRLDRRARLEGGMPRERLSAWQKKHNDQVSVLRTELADLGRRFVEADRNLDPFRTAMNLARAKLIEQKKTLRQVWGLLGKALPQLREKFAERHQQEQSLTTKAKAEFEIALDNYLRASQEGFAAAHQYKAKAAQLMTIDRADPRNKRMHDIATNYLYNYWRTQYDIELQKFSDTYETERGESYGELSERGTAELNDNLTNAYEELLVLWNSQFEIFKQMIGFAEKLEDVLQQADPTARKLIQQESSDHASVTSVGIKQSLLMFLSELVFNRNHHSREAAEHPFVMELSAPMKEKVILSHAEITATSGYSNVEQMEVLKSVLDLYERLGNAVDSLAEMGSGFIREAYRIPFLEHLAEARTGLETQLADLILVDEGFAPQPAPITRMQTKQSTKVVFKTRSQETLVGELRPSTSDTPERFIEIHDPVTRKVVATYHEHTHEGVWVEVVPSPPTTPAIEPLKRTLDTIKNEAQTVIARRAGIERTIRAQQKKLLDPTRREELRPLEWDEMLSPQARKLEALANEIERDHSTHASAAALTKAYRDESLSLNRLARELCSAGFLQQRPKAANIAYLWKHGFVAINLVRRRIALKAGDFLTEYVIRDATKIREGQQGDDIVLWYAHFHYPTADTPALQPTFGHLKTKEERLFTRKELIEQARTNFRTVVNLEKATIKPPLDQMLFLNLEPPPPRAPR
ncbi:dermonecrotic toxin domain-containing protein [Pseudomonas sp. SDO524_S393]